MKAVVMRESALVVDRIDDPTPGPGEVLTKTLACGICGSDLHMLHHCEHMLGSFKRVGIPIGFDPGKGVVFGHEYCAEILDHGPDCDKKLKPGTRVCSLPYVITPTSFDHVGYSNRYPGGYGEHMVLSEGTLMPVPGDLPSELAALTEPLAIAVHAVGRAQLGGEEVPIVIGCGPIGLAVIIALKALGIGPIVAADFSAKRRALAEKLGADIVVDPAEKSPYESWVAAAAPARYDIKGPFALFGLGPQPRPCVVFECVGVPGLIQQALLGAPPRSRVIVVGVCMQADSIEPIVGIAKEMNVHFSFGYTAEEFGRTLAQLADGKLDAASMITGKVDMQGVADAFLQLAKPDAHAKMMIAFA